MQYVLTDGVTGEKQLANATFWHGERYGVLYRRQFFNYRLQAETHWQYALNLADIAVPYGVLRADRLRLFRTPVSLTLGSFGFPDNGTTVSEKVQGSARAIILKGFDALGNRKQLAMTVLNGWSELTVVHSENTNPDSEKSLFVLARTESKRLYDSSEPYLLVSQVLTKESHEDFTDDELFPVAAIQFSDCMQTGGYGVVTLTMKTGTVHQIDFSDMEGELLL